MKVKRPDIIIEGEMQADIAFKPDVISELFPFSDLKENTNVLICPDLTSANIAYKLLSVLGGATSIGPMLLGIKHPVYLLSSQCYVEAEEKKTNGKMKSPEKKLKLETVKQTVK